MQSATFGSKGGQVGGAAVVVGFNSKSQEVAVQMQSYKFGSYGGQVIAGQLAYPFGFRS